MITHIAVATISTAAGTQWKRVEEKRLDRVIGLQLQQGTET